MIAMVVEMELRLFIEVIPIATIAELMYQTRKTGFDHNFQTPRRELKMRQAGEDFS